MCKGQEIPQFTVPEKIIGGSRTCPRFFRPYHLVVANSARVWRFSNRHSIALLLLLSPKSRLFGDPPCKTRCIVHWTRSAVMPAPSVREFGITYPHNEKKHTVVGVLLFMAEDKRFELSHRFPGLLP